MIQSITRAEWVNTCTCPFKGYNALSTNFIVMLETKNIPKLYDVYSWVDYVSPEIAASATCNMFVSFP